MEFIQASFQASFDARVERVNANELAELRTIFGFFDTDNDGAVAADQACRMFALLGLDVNPMYVQDLEEVYLNEFLKIVDSHMPVPSSSPAVATDLVGAESGDSTNADSSQASVSPVIPILRITDHVAGASAALAANANTSASGQRPVGTEPHDLESQLVLDEDELRKRNEQLWESEWKLLDSYRRGFVSLHELRLFLANCGSAIPACDLLRFMEVYGDSAGEAPAANRDGEREHNGSSANQDTSDRDVIVLTKAGFFKFLKEYTERDMRGSDNSNDEDDEEHLAEKRTMHHDQSVREDDADGLKNTSNLEQRRREQRNGSIGDDDGDNNTSSSRRHSLIVVEPGVIDESHFDAENDEDEDEDGDEGEGEAGDVASQLSDDNSSKSSASSQYNNADEQ